MKVKHSERAQAICGTFRVVVASLWGSNMRLQRMLRPLSALPLLLALLSLATYAAAAIDKDNKSSSPVPDAELQQHNVINLSLHTEIKGANNNNSSSSKVSSDADIKFDLTRTQRLRDSLNVFDLSLLAEQWPRLEAERLLSLNCTKDMRSYLRALSEATMWAVKSKYSQPNSGNWGIKEHSGNETKFSGKRCEMN